MRLWPSLPQPSFPASGRGGSQSRAALRFDSSRFFRFPLSRSRERGLGGEGSPGFSLIETLVALALIGVTLLLAMALLAQEPGMARRMTAQEEILGVLDVVQESVRAGYRLPDGTEVLDWRALFEPGYTPRHVDGLQIWSEVTPHGRRLDQVVLRARWQADGQTFERTVHTLVQR